METIDADTDLFVPMYPSPAKLERYAAAHELDSSARPLIMCEYSHAMGNSCGGLAEYWRVIRAHGVLQGGCIWDFADQGLCMPLARAGTLAEVGGHTAGRRLFGYGGDFGPPGTPSDEAFCINGLVQPDRQLNPHAVEARSAMQPIWAVAGPSGVSATEVDLVISNEHDFLSLAPFALLWEVQEQGAPVRGGVITELPHCAAHSSVRLTFEHTPADLPLRPVERHLFVRFARKADRAEVAWAQFGLPPWPRPPSLLGAAAGCSATYRGSTSVQVVDVEGAAELIVPSAEMTVAFSRATGLPTSLKYQGQERLAAPLEPSLWRPLNDNELGSGRHNALHKWRGAGRPSQEGGGYMRMLRGPTATACTDGRVVVRSKAALTADGETVLFTTCTVHPAASAVEVRARVVLSGGGAGTDAEAPAQDGGDDGADRGDILRDGAVVVLRSDEAAAYLDVEGSRVRARWDDSGAWQQLLVRAALERPPDDSPIRYGDAVFLIAHTGVMLSAAHAGAPLSAAPDGGALTADTPAATATQRFVLEPAAGGELAGQLVRCGAPILLKGCNPAGGSRPEFIVPGAEHADGDASLSEAKSTWRFHRGRAANYFHAAPLRVGIECALERSCATRVRWFGRGPHESYPDRHDGAPVGQWDGRVADQTFRYCRPQETGNKMETRWMALSDDAGESGTLVLSLSAPLSMQCHHHALADLDTLPETRTNRVRHGAELEQQDLTTLCVDGAMAGVGGIDSWGNLPLPQHLLSLDQPVEWAFALRPFVGLDDPAALVADLVAEA